MSAVLRLASDADEVTHYRVETNNIGASSNKKDHDNDLDVEDDIVSCYSAMVSKGAKISQSKDLDGIPDDVVFEFESLCSDKEDGDEYIDDIITEMPADIPGPGISIDAHVSTKGREFGREDISGPYTWAQVTPE